MKTVFTSPSIMEAHQAEALLNDAGIKCVINNEILSFIAGEVPVAATWPQVDIFDEADSERALEVISKMKTVEKVVGEKWQCSSCEEVHEPQFTMCWNCGGDKE